MVSVLRKSLRAAVLVGGVAFAAAPASAESIHGALAKAYQYNASLNSARAGVRITDEGVAVAKSGFRPAIGASANLSHTYNRSGNLGTATSVGSFGLQIQQSLFDGFRTLNSVRSAESRVSASNEALRNTEQDILFNAAAAFVDVIRDRQVAVFRERNLEFLGEQVRAATSRFEVGEGTRTDVAQAEASRSAAIAQLSAARAQARASEAQYQQIIGDPPGRLDAPSPVAKLLPANAEQAVSFALTQHPAVKAAQHLVDASSFDVRTVEGELLPQLSAQAGVSRNVTYNDLPGVGSDYTERRNQATIGLNLSIPIYQGGRVSAQVRQAKESLGQARIEVDVARDQVRQLVTSAWTQYVAAQQVVSANRELVSVAQLVLSGVQEERNVGQRTTLDVLNAQADVIDAQINLASAQRDVVAASYAILSSVGWLSAERLGLQVAIHQPREHYDAIKDKWYGTRTPDGR